MINALKRWWQTRTKKAPVTREHYSREQVLKLMEQAKDIGYNDGKRDGLAIAREQATKSLKEILWQQNQQQK